MVLLKDTALGYIVAYPELLQQGVNVETANFGNVVPAAIVIAVIYIVINSLLTLFAGWLERRTRRSGIRVPRGQVRTATIEPQGESARELRHPRLAYHRPRRCGWTLTPTRAISASRRTR